MNSLFPYTLGWEKTCTCHIYCFAYGTCQFTAHNTSLHIYLRKNGSKAPSDTKAEATLLMDCSAPKLRTQLINLFLLDWLSNHTERKK